MDYVFITDKKGNVLHACRNLRIVIRYAKMHKTWVESYGVIPAAKGTALLQVYWADGAECTTTFNCYDVCVDWVQRRRGWPKRYSTYGNPHTAHLKGNKTCRN